MDIQKKPYYMIVTEDKPGEAARLTAAMMRAQVDLEGMWGFGSGDSQHAQFIVVPQDRAAFERAARVEGWVVQPGTCFRISGEDRRGALVESLQKIAASGINLRGVDAMAFEGQFGCYLWVDEHGLPKLEAILGV